MLPLTHDAPSHRYAIACAHAFILNVWFKTVVIKLVHVDIHPVINVSHLEVSSSVISTALKSHTSRASARSCGPGISAKSTGSSREDCAANSAAGQYLLVNSTICPAPRRDVSVPSVTSMM